METDKDEFPIGFSYLDQMKYLARITVIGYSFVCGLIFLIFFLFGLLPLDLYIMFILPLIVDLLILMTSFFMIPFMFLVMSFQYYHIKNNCTNHVVFKKTRLRVAKQMGSRAPMFKVEIPYTLIDHAVELDDETYMEWKKTSMWFHRLGMTYTKPHGSMHVPMTGRQNLMIIYLNKRIKVRNHDLTNPLTKQPPIRTKRVKRVIVDIQPERHVEFLHRLDDEIVEAKLRMMDMKGVEIKKHPKVAQAPPGY